jgi:LPS sulfotransferase NodH
MTANGVFGTKLMLGYLDATAEFLGAPFNLKASQFDQVFERYFPGARYLHLFRRDKVDQAVSMFIASHTDAWRSGRGNGEVAVPPYDAASILRWHELLMREDSEWIRRLSAVGSFAGSVAYEDLRYDYYRTISKVFSLLDLHPSACPPPDMTSVKRQVSSVKSHYIERFKAEVIRHHD